MSLLLKSRQLLLQIVVMSHLTCTNILEKVVKKFVIRVKDTKSNGFLKGFGLSQKGIFDKEVNLWLTRRHTNKIKADKSYQFLRKKASFDYLSHDSKDSYPVSFRVVRIKLSEDSYESLITNLDSFTFKSTLSLTLGN